MRRSVLVLALVATAGAAAVLVVSAFTADRDYRRLLSVGDAALARAHTLEAIEAYSGAIALRSDAMLAHLKRGMAYQRQGEWDKAVHDVRRAVALDPSAPRAWELLGDLEEDLGRHNRAAQSFRRGLDLDDRSPAVLYKLGLALYRDGQFARAVDPLRRALGFEPRLAEAHLALGVVFAALERPQEARAALEEAVRLSPGLTAPREALAEVHRVLGEPGPALDQLEALAALESGQPSRLIAVANAHAAAGHRDTAVAILGRGLERSATPGELYAALGHIWLQSAETTPDRFALNRALGALSAAVRDSAASAATYTDLGRALMLTGDLDGAAQALTKATAAPPVPPHAFFYLAEVETRAARPRAARDALVRYATLLGDDRAPASTAARIGTLSLTLGEPRVALHWFERAADAEHEDPAVVNGLAQARAALGR